jgi:cytochrome b561
MNSTTLNNNVQAQQQRTERYTAVAVLLHWLIALCLFGQIAFGWFLETIPRGTPLRGPYVNIHKSTGIILGVLILIRLVWRLAHRSPDYPAFVAQWERLASKVTQFLLYTCMLVMPLSGYVASNFSKYGVKFFNSVLLPPWAPEDKAIYAALNTTHVVTSYLLVALIVLHLLGALRHAFRRDGIIGRMWTGGARN